MKNFNKNFNFIITIDVESEKTINAGILHHTHYKRDIELPVLHLLTLLKKHHLTAIFMLPLSEISRDYPQVIPLAQNILNHHHELALHLHIPVNHLPLAETTELVRNEIHLFQTLLNYTPLSARAGGFNTGKDGQWFKALESNQVKYDSSIISGGNTLTSHHWSTTARERESQRWGQNAYYFDFRNAPLTGVYPMNTQDVTQTGNSPLCQCPITCLTSDPLHVQSFDLQNIGEDRFNWFLDRFQPVANSLENHQPLIITTFAHSLGNYTCPTLSQQSQDRFLPTQALRQLENNFKRLAHEVKKGRAESIGFHTLQNQKSIHQAIFEKDIHQHLTQQLKNRLTPHQHILVLRTAPAKNIEALLNLLNSLNLDLHIDLLVQENAMAMFKNCLPSGHIIPFPANQFHQATLSRLLKSLKKKYHYLFFIYNNPALSGYSNIERPVLQSRIPGLALRKDLDALFDITHSHFVSRKKRQLFFQHLQTLRHRFKLATIKTILRLYFLVQLLLSFPFNLSYSLYLKLSHKKFPPIVPLDTVPGCVDLQSLYSFCQPDTPRFFQQVERLLHGFINILGYLDLPYKQGHHVQWHTDFVSGYTWPLLPRHSIRYGRPNDHNDIKIPWELSRFHHVLMLALAYHHQQQHHHPAPAQRYLKEIISQWSSWLQANPYQSGVNWVCPMEVGIRAINWLFILDLVKTALNKDFYQLVQHSLQQHGHFIYNHLEYSPLGRGNHYMTNIVSLLFLGVYFHREPYGQQWLHWAIPEFIHEIGYQFNPDGTSDEGSTRYHILQAELVELAMQLLQKSGLADQYIPPWVHEKINRIRQFSADLQVPSFPVPLIGDNDSGRILPLPLLLPVKGRDCSVAYPHGGFYFIRSSRALMVLRCGLNGYRGISVHDHCDQLSFELLLPHSPFIVDPGTHVYTPDYQQRDLFRSTASHNTLQIENWEQGSFAPGQLFIMKDEAQARLLQWQTNDRYDFFSGCHYGYSRFRPSLVHQRQVLFLKTNSIWWLYDQLLGAVVDHEQNVYLYFHLAPSVKPTFESLVGSLQESVFRGSGLGQVERLIPPPFSLPSGPFQPLLLTGKDPRIQVRLFFPIDDSTQITIDQASFAGEYGKLEQTSKITVRRRGWPSHFSTIIALSCPGEI